MSDDNNSAVAVLIERANTFERHCRDTHRAVEQRINDIYHTLHGNGREGIMEKLKGHTQEIAAIRSNLDSVRKEVHTINEKIGGLNVQFWKMGAVIALIAGSTSAGVAGIIKALF